MLVLVSDVHLTDSLRGATVPRADTFERFWVRIRASRGQRPAILCFVGDLFDVVRSARWFDTAYRPYHEPDRHVVAVVDSIVDTILERERDFFGAIRSRVAAGELEVRYVLGNHDRLLRDAPAARRRLWQALTGEDREVHFEDEAVFPDHGVLAFHGHASDAVNASPDGAATIGDAIGTELITRFPHAVRILVDESHPELDDIDDVRPVYAVPAWVRQLGVLRPELIRPVNDTWCQLVETFLSKPFVQQWTRSQRRGFAFDAGKRLRLLLELSTRRIVARGSDRRLTDLYKLLQHGFDGKMAAFAAQRLGERRGLRFVVNGHSHFANMVPLGNVGGRPAVYFNTGTWRSVHQLGHGVGGRPTFLAYDAMSYLVFFPSGDRLGRDFEWWNGALVAR